MYISVFYAKIKAMKSNIDTKLIITKFKEPKDCALCEIKNDVEKHLIHEYLNDAVMDDDCRIEVGKNGFCQKHYGMLFSGQNKLSLALQIETYGKVTVSKLMRTPKSVKEAKKISKELNKTTCDCVICKTLEETMDNYYKAICKLFVSNKEFFKFLVNGNGFCMPHYAKLLDNSSYAGMLSKNLLGIISETQRKRINNDFENLDTFCKKHDYRNSLQPLGKSEDCLIKIKETLFGVEDK